MKKSLSILVGCDISLNLSHILKCLNSSFNYNYISASRTSDIFNIIRSIEPIMVILNFRNNQQALSNTCSFLGDLNVPILCLTRKLEGESLFWPKQCIVFTQSLESSIKDRYLNIRINSIIQLLNTSSFDPYNKSLTQKAQREFTTNKERQIGRYIMELDQKVCTLKRVRNLIKELYSDVDDSMRIKLVSIVSLIKISIGDKKQWDDFKLYLENVDQEFLTQLSERHPGLTPRDVKYCYYLKMNMSNDDIRNVLGINQESVRTHKYRLKKKFSLLKDQDLKAYIGGFSQTKQIS